MNVYEKIYMSWRFEALTPSFATRAGVRECGCAIANPGPFYYDKGQSLVEHAMGVRTLVEGVMMEESILLTDVPKDEYQRTILSKTAALHDSSEALLAGDICDNGSARDKALEDLKERNVFEEQLLYYPSWIQAGILKCFLEFQEKSTSRGWLLYCADKTDAILTVLEYAAMGRPGSVLDNKYCSEQDETNWGICGTSAPFECWLVQFFDDISCHLEYVDISQIFVNIILIGRNYCKGTSYRDISGVDRKVSADICWLSRFNTAKNVVFPCSLSLDSLST